MLKEEHEPEAVSITRASLEEHGKIVETVAYDFLFSKHFLLS